jgi:NADH:ubiquinone oxidoreductase subunit 3 (subunit A)
MITRENLDFWRKHREAGSMADRLRPEVDGVGEEEWGEIEELVSRIRMDRAGLTSPDFREETEALLQSSTTDAEVAGLLRRAALEPPPPGTSESPRPRTVGHYLLLLTFLLFAVESVLFFTTALHNAGRNQATAVRFLFLTLGTFATAVTAMGGFARRINAAGAAFVGLLAAQPVLNAFLPPSRAGMPPRIGEAVVCGLISVSLLIAVVRSNRTGGV